MKRNRDRKLLELAKVPLFAGCTREQLIRISELTFGARCAAGDTICSEGESGRACFIIVEGEACVTMAGRHFANIGPGGFFGEMALLDGSPRIASVIALTEVRLLTLSPLEFDALLVSVPHVARRMMAIMGSRLRSADKLVVEGVTSPASG